MHAAIAWASVHFRPACPPLLRKIEQLRITVCVIEIASFEDIVPEKVDICIAKCSKEPYEGTVIQN